MDFESLLHVAQRNSQKDKKAQTSKYYSTKFEAPKKIEKDKKLSANIQKFLQKKEEEEKEKKRLAQESLKSLLSMRTDRDKNKIRKMLKVTKSANKSVLADAVDNNNTAITLVGPEQPDEDDYGYVSQEASQLYRQLMDKYKKDPEEDKKFSKSSKPSTTVDLSNTKNRVKAAIQRAQEEEAMPHRRQRQSGAKDGERSDNTTTATTVDEMKSRSHKKNLYDPDAERMANEERKREEQRMKAKQRKPAPVMDFRQLLQLAEQKQFEPVEVEIDLKPKEPERLLTNKEKRELEERNRYFAEREKRKQAKSHCRNGNNDDSSSSGGGGSSSNNKSVDVPQKMEPNGRIPKLNSSGNPPQPIKKPSNQIKNVNRKEINPSSSSIKSKPLLDSASQQQKPMQRPNVAARPSSSSSSTSSNQLKPTTSNGRVQNAVKPTTITRELPPKDLTRKPTSGGKPVVKPSSSSVNPKPTTSSSKSTTLTQKSRDLPSNQELDAPRKSNVPNQKTRPFPPSNNDRARQLPPPNSDRARQLPPPNNDRVRQFPPSNNDRARQFPPPNTDRGRQFPPMDVRRDRKKPPKRPVIDEDDSEYDSEMDDFIDDGPEEADYSKYIKEIFGYDKSRYRDKYDDLNNMESSFSQQMKEEYISKKIGIMEDLEDMRLEAEEKKRSKTKKLRLK